MLRPVFSREVLKLDRGREVERISAGLRDFTQKCRKRGAVVALSGGIDSSTVAALCVAALGKERVFGLHMPERDSSGETLRLSRSVSTHFGFSSVEEDLTDILEAVGCYARRDEAIRSVIPEYGGGWKSKIALSNAAEGEGFNFYSVVAQSPDGAIVRKRLPHEAYLQTVAATNFKQRVRKMLEYYHADRLNYLVAGTPNRLEYDQGFFVKLGDGAGDVKPIAHLYKSQVYELAEYLGVPEEIRRRPPTTDTYSLPQGQDEFYFSVPYDKMDLCLYGKNHGVPAAEAALAAGLTEEQAKRVYKEIDVKRRSTSYLHLKPRLLAEVPEIGSE
jgi:NAD+ synthase